MAERQQLRLQVIGLIRAGHSASSAARTIGVPLATAKRWAKLFHENNEVSNRAIPGRPRISTREEDAILVTEAENHPFRSAFELKMASNFPGSPLTARRRLRERGIRSRRTATKEHLKIEHIVDRLAYATIRQDFDWRNVIFSDEVVVSSSNYGPPRVYRIDGHRYDERFVARLYKSGRVSVACWGWMSYDGAGTLERIHGRFTVDTYEHILTNVMIPSAREWYPEGRLHFQQDNHPVHTAIRIQEWFTRRPDIELLEWPPYAPDMNPIENVWARVKGILRSNWAEAPPRTSDELWDRLLNAWEEVATDVDLFHNLVDSMPRRMRAVVNAGGMWTKY